jgi:hypothetical protein
MSNPLRSVGLIVVMLVPAFGPLLGQEPAINSGAKVRVTMAGQRDPLIGILQGRSRDSLLVAVTSRKDSLRAIGMDQVTKVEKWDTRKGAIPKSWAIGTAVGALFGTVVGLVIPAGCEGEEGWCVGPRDTGDMVEIGLAGGAVLGGVVGLIVGAVNHHSWVPIDLAMVSPGDPSAGVTVTGRLSLPAVHFR